MTHVIAGSQRQIRIVYSLFTAFGEADGSLRLFPNRSRLPGSCLFLQVSTVPTCRPTPSESCVNIFPPYSSILRFIYTRADELVPAVEDRFRPTACFRSLSIEAVIILTFRFPPLSPALTDPRKSTPRPASPRYASPSCGTCPALRRRWR